jgi:hypothetical protein
VDDLAAAGCDAAVGDLYGEHEGNTDRDPQPG